MRVPPPAPLAFPSPFSSHTGCDGDEEKATSDFIRGFIIILILLYVAFSVWSSETSFAVDCRRRLGQLAGECCSCLVRTLSRSSRHQQWLDETQAAQPARPAAGEVLVVDTTEQIHVCRVTTLDGVEQETNGETNGCRTQ